mgnify:CR=1 FL=1
MKSHDEEHNLMMRIIFGDKDSGEIGMKAKVDEMHSILLATQNVSGFFGGVKGTLGWLLLIGAVIALLKGWFAGLISFLLLK